MNGPRHLGFVDATGESAAPMATAIAAAMLGPAWQVAAWALAPAPQRDPLAAQVLAEWGLEWDWVRTEAFRLDRVPTPSVLIWLGTVPPAATAEGIVCVRWPLPDRGAGLEARRSQRDRIRHRLEEWAAGWG